LPDVDEHTGHILVHFLCTGTYQTLHDIEISPEEEARVEFKRAFSAFVTANTYELAGLQHLAMHNIKQYGECMTILDIVGAIDEDFSKLSDSTTNFQDYLTTKAKDAFQKDHNDFYNNGMFDSITNVALSKTLAKCAMELYRDKITHLLQAENNGWDFGFGKKTATEELTKPAATIPEIVPEVSVVNPFLGLTKSQKKKLEKKMKDEAAAKAIGDAKQAKTDEDAAEIKRSEDEEAELKRLEDEEAEAKRLENEGNERQRLESEAAAAAEAEEAEIARVAAEEAERKRADEVAEAAKSGGWGSSIWGSSKKKESSKERRAREKRELEEAEAAARVVQEEQDRLAQEEADRAAQEEVERLETLKNEAADAAVAAEYARIKAVEAFSQAKEESAAWGPPSKKKETTKAKREREAREKKAKIELDRLDQDASDATAAAEKAQQDADDAEVARATARGEEPNLKSVQGPVDEPPPPPPAEPDAEPAAEAAIEPNASHDLFDLVNDVPADQLLAEFSDPVLTKKEEAASGWGTEWGKSLPSTKMTERKVEESVVVEPEPEPEPVIEEALFEPEPEWPVEEILVRASKKKSSKKDKAVGEQVSADLSKSPPEIMVKPECSGEKEFSAKAAAGTCPDHVEHFFHGEEWKRCRIC
jgi:hypothetical protein